MQFYIYRFNEVHSNMFYGWCEEIKTNQKYMFVTLFLSISPLGLDNFRTSPHFLLPFIQLEYIHPYIHIQMDFVNFIMSHYLRSKTEPSKLNEYNIALRMCTLCNLCRLFAINRSFNFISVLQFYRKMH